MNNVGTLTFEEAVKLLKNNKFSGKRCHWEISKENGWSVAHEAAILGMLFSDFDQWDITDNRGYTIRDIHNKKYSL